jgi:uncharacterized protein YbcC (UPF0753/DUF2309 family)/formate hydrogenlyase subunit 3/multisubunit Na+/H+ antiporter MnhD subunit
MLSLHLGKVTALLSAVVAAFFLLNPTTLEFGPATVQLGIVNALLMLFVSLLVLVVAAYSQRNLMGQNGLTRFGLLLIAALSGLLTMVTAGTLIQFALGWTVSGQATAALIAHADTASAHRAARYVRSWLTASDVLVWLAAASLALPNSGQISITWISGHTFVAGIAGLALVLASIVRTGLFPAHRWLAQTAEAPSPVSAFLHAGIINAAGISAALWLPMMRPWLPILLVSACASLVIGLLTMHNRGDVKGQLASSTGMQMAFMSIEAAVGLPGLAIAHLIGHGSYKSWCFLRAGGAITRSRLGFARHRRSGAVAVLSVSIATFTALVTSALIGSFEPLTLIVGVVAAASVIVYGYRGRARSLAIITAVSVASLAGYLVAAHLWLTWIPLPHWTDAPLTAVAVIAIVAAALATRLLPKGTARRLSWYLIAPRWMRLPRRQATILPSASLESADLAQLDELIDVARGSVEASWPLRTAVAVNPVSSLTNLTFEQAAQMAGAWGSKLYASPAQYLSLWDRGAIDAQQLRSTLGYATALEPFINRTRILAANESHSAVDTSSPAWETAHRWCQLVWAESTSTGDLFTQWRDALPEHVARTISPDPIVALSQALEAHSQIQPALAADPNPTGRHLRILTQLLTAAPGWAAHAHWRGREAVVQLLAVRACLTALYAEALPVEKVADFPDASIWQLALESSFDAWLGTQLATARSRTDSSYQTRIGVVTCIDVRSEPMRRALESNPMIRTYGAAGFFGVDACLRINDQTIGLAPVIVSPSVVVDARERQSWLTDLTDGITRTMEGLGGLAIAEGYGVTALGASLLSTFAPKSMTKLPTQPDVWLGTTGLEVSGLTEEQQLTYARSFLDTLGQQDFPELMVIAGHAADAANNAFAAAYQCGACGGNSGAVNARLIVAMLSNPTVRRHLISDGYGIERTRFVAALHNTTSNTIELDPSASLLGDCGELANQLMQASTRAQSQLMSRDISLPGSVTEARGWDWAQPFPEWGLVGNAACIIGPRDLTKGADLAGRVFLHEYDWTSDPDGSLLNGILAGPGAVMHMINMQYYCSTVDQRSFGSLDKTRHNAVGDLGVLVGASGDLHYGLPWQSLGPRPDELLHAPVRLRILVAAPAEQLTSAMSGTLVEKLAANGWLVIESLTTKTATAHLRDRNSDTHVWPEEIPSVLG